MAWQRFAATLLAATATLLAATATLLAATATLLAATATLLAATATLLAATATLLAATATLLAATATLEHYFWSESGDASPRATRCAFAPATAVSLTMCELWERLRYSR